MALQKDGSLIINNFQNGIGESQYSGFGRMQNLEIFQVPGIVRMKARQALYFTPDSLPRAMIKYKDRKLYTGTANGKLYRNTEQAPAFGAPGGVVQASGGIYDLKVVKDYLMIGYDGGIDLLGPLNVNPAVSDLINFPGWQTGITQNYAVPLAVLTGNDIIYFGNGNYVGTITNFTPNANITIAPSATINLTAIPLQSGDFVQSLAILGRTLLIGTQGGQSFTDISTTSVSNIYPYDLGSLTLGTPIPLEENGINQMFTVDNQTFIHAGIFGNVYITNGSSIQFYKRINFNRNFGVTMFPYPNAINFINNELLIGTSAYQDAYPGSESIHGIYSIRDKKLNFKTISTYNHGADQTLKVGCLLPAGQDLLYSGWQDGSTYGVDVTDNTMSQNFTAFFESQVEVVADPQNNATYDDIIVYLAKPLIAGQEIQLKWRDGRSESWNTIATLTSANASSDSSALFAKALINNATTVQVQCAMKQSQLTEIPNIEILGIKINKHTK